VCVCVCVCVEGGILVLNLKVEMSKEPVLEKGILNIAGACQLE